MSPRPVTLRHDKGLAFTARVGGHTLLIDEPETSGGGDVGPTPQELLSAAVGSCTAITVLMYSQRKGWPVSDVSAQVSREDDALAVVVSITGTLDEAQRTRLAQVATRCPVSRVVHQGMPVTHAVEWVDDA